MVSYCAKTAFIQISIYTYYSSLTNCTKLKLAVIADVWFFKFLVTEWSRYDHAQQVMNAYNPYCSKTQQCMHYAHAQATLSLVHDT